MLYELETNYLDILLLHAVDNEKMLEEYSSIIPQLEKLPVKNIGISSHVPHILSKIADNDKIKIVMAPINFKGFRIESDQIPTKRRNSMINILQKCKDNNKDIISIKVYGKGKIKDYKKSINYINDLGFIDIIDIGMYYKTLNKKIKIILK